MKFFNNNSLIAIILLLTSFNTYTITIESIATTVETLMSSISTSTSSSNTSTIAPTIEFAMEPYQYTIQTNDGLIHIEGLRNVEMGYDQHSATYEPYSLNDYNKPDATPTSNLETKSTTNCEQDIDLQCLSNNIDIPDISNTSNMSQKSYILDDLLKDSACDARKQEISENYATPTQNIITKQQKVIREQDLQKNRVYFHRDFAGIPLDSDLILQKPNVFHDPRSALSLPIIKGRFNRLNYFYEYQKNLGKNVEHELNFLNALNSGKVVQLLDQIYDAHLSIAKSAFDELKKLWIRERKHMFLTPNSYNHKELDFLTKLGIDIIIKAERALITRSDYIAEHADTQSLKIIQEYKEHCTQLQQKGERLALLNEIEKLRQTVKKRSNFATKIYFAIAHKTYFDPATTALDEIAHVPSLEKARSYVKNLELQLLTQAQQRNIINESHMRAWLTEHYGFDLLDAAHNCYKSRADYIYTPNNQSYLSDRMQPILRNIESKNLQGAHAELIHLKKQIDKALTESNITDPITQKEHIKKSFDKDVLELAHTTYKARSDHKKLAEFFMAIDVNQAATKILENNNTYESVANEMNDLAKHVFGNARLCSLSNLPKIESHVYDSIDAMRIAQDHPTFIFNFSMVNRTLGDIQQIAHAILSGKHPVLERSSELLIISFDTFFKGLNPLTQTSNISHLVSDLGSLLKKGGSALWNDPITTIDKGLSSTFTLTELIRNTADFTSDLTVGRLYLSPEEYKQRIDTFCKIMGPLQNTTADHYAVFIGQFMAEVVFFKGLGTAYNFLKEIDLLEKLGESTAVVARTFKKGFDTHLANNPIMITAEGVTFQMSNDLKNISKTTKEIINNSKVLLETATTALIDTAFFTNLKSIGDNLWKSPGGLIYGYDRKFDNTLNHVLSHMTPNAIKKNHTVFSVSKDKIVQLIDEAWVIKGNSLASDPRAYIIDMKKIIGTNGETAIRIVLKEPGTCEIITAYPVKI